MRKKLIFLFILFFSMMLHSQEIVISGWQQSTINYTLEQNIQVPSGINRLSVSIVEPQDFSSLTYQQTVTGNSIDFTPEPQRDEKDTDRFGNITHRFYWDSPAENIQFTAVFNVKTAFKLTELESQAPYPVNNLDAETRIFLEPTDQIQSDHPQIQQKAREINRDFSREIEVVRATLHFVVDHMRYTLVPEKYDALYALQTGRGNCQNYSHLSAALLRASGIPVRIVNGVTFKRNYTVPVDQSEFRDRKSVV